ncbi:hypothetical protein EPUS_09470 [Endocarpon pusillum Z07020]|uniref:Fungal N-terminal domain-containing protein n=1 Tax=Endocarpon pusillum (strain Z07020 / HMAS-L-300199) TaxID=1263415 RepID=U1GT12_ENDPU|nr:uncharacterized protein EPUS_09470 [Endocarpon pusillum Z07020]ERF75553.1 hypothetical protein EPUS_09470 [Endocarpon pusillum Z07020]
MDIAAGVVGFVGLSGQILQGCNYLCKTFCDAADAPDVIVAILTELRAVRSRLEAFQHLLLEIQASAPACLRVQQDPAIPLQNCQNVIQKVQSFVDKYADLSISTASSSGNLKSHKAAFHKAWQKFDVARKGDQLRGYVSQLEAAKSSLLATQISIQLALQLQHFDTTRGAQRNLQQLQDEHTASAQIVKETKNLVSDVHSLQKDSHLLAKMTNLSLDKIVSNNQTLLVQFASSEQYAYDTKIASHFTQNAIESLNANLNKRFDDLPTILAPIIQDTITQSLAIHNSSRETEVLSTKQRPDDITANLYKGSPYTGNNCLLPRQTRSVKTLLQHESASSLLPDDLKIMSINTDIPAENLMHSMQLGRRGPKRQKTTKSVFNVWFGRIELTSLTTEQEGDVDSDYIPPTRLQARRTSFQLIPNSWFLKFGLLFETGKSRPTISHPGWDNRLRVIRTHQMDSSVYETIHRGDYVGFRKLLESREVTPFDLIDFGYSTIRTLFEIVVHHIIPATRDENHVMQRDQLEIAKMLADSGVDCGVGIGLLWLLKALGFKSNEANLSLFRIIMTQSQTDPFEESGQKIAQGNFLSARLSLLTKQDEWDLSEFTKLFEDYWGNGSFQHRIRNDRSSDEWHEIQKLNWSRMPISLRRSRSYCVAVFGPRFIDFSWPELYWSAGKPAFWQSKQACEEFFGSYFVKYDWPLLLWREELPTFWHSRKACLEIFGEYFIAYDWPHLLGKLGFDFLEGKGAWKQRRRWHWDEEGRNIWITQMIECWSKDDIPKRHARQYCIDQYGVNFVKEELPSLLRQDGLPEEEVVQLTEDGPDMEPPAPVPFWKYEESVSLFECEESEDSQDEHDADSDAASDGDSDAAIDGDSDIKLSDGHSDDELSDGWQTAEED